MDRACGHREAASTNAVDPIDHTYTHHLITTVHMYASSMKMALDGIHAAIVISPDEQPIRVKDGGRTMSFSAAAINPAVHSEIQHADTRVLSIRLEPTHECFRAFCALPGAGILPLDLTELCQNEIRAATRGELPLDLATAMMSRTLASVLPQLPDAGSQDPRALRAFESVCLDPTISLDDIANALGVSYGRASRLFTQSIGIPFRTFRLWLKVRQFGLLLSTGASYTAAAHSAGFSDSAHVCRAFRKLYGRPPSYFFGGRSAKIHALMPPHSNPSQPNAWKAGGSARGTCR